MCLTQSLLPEQVIEANPLFALGVMFSLCPLLAEIGQQGNASSFAFDLEERNYAVCGNNRIISAKCGVVGNILFQVKTYFTRTYIKNGHEKKYLKYFERNK